MQYAVLGDESRPLSRQDLSYAHALSKTTLLDLQTVLASAEKLTSNTAAIISDKYALLMDANAKLDAVKDTAVFKALIADAINAKILSEYIANVTEIARLEPEAAKLTPVQEPQSAGALSAYNPIKPTPFMSAPTASPGMPLAPSKDLTSKLFKPLVTLVNIPGFKPGSVWISNSGAATSASASGKSMSIPLILAGIAAAAFALK